MQKYIIPIFTFLMGCTISLTAQKIEFSGGVNQNTFIGGVFYQDDPYTNSDYSSGNGFGIYAALDSFRYEFMVYRFTLGFEQYQGGFDVSSGGKAVGNHKVGNLQKSKIMLGIYPGNFRIQNLDINLGLELGFLVNQKVNGTNISSSYSQPRPDTTDLSGNSISNNGVSVDFKLRLAYDIYLTKRLALSPVVSGAYGVSNEFNSYPYARSFRFFFGVAVERTFVKNE